MIHQSHWETRKVSVVPLPGALVVWQWVSFLLSGGLACGTTIQSWTLQSEYVYTDLSPGAVGCTDVAALQHTGRTVWFRVMWTVISALILVIHLVWLGVLLYSHVDWWYLATLHSSDTIARQPLAASYRVYMIFQIGHLFWYTITQLCLTVLPTINDARYSDFLILFSVMWLSSLVPFFVSQYYIVYNWYTGNTPSAKHPPRRSRKVFETSLEPTP